MQGAKIGLAAVGLLAIFTGEPARGQGIGIIPDGVFLGVTPAVSADRRYVRISVDTNFSTLNGFSTFEIPAAVGGGGGVGFGGGLAGMNGPIGIGATDGYPSAGPMNFGAVGSPFAASFAQFLDAPEPSQATPQRARAARARAAKRAARPPKTRG